MSKETLSLINEKRKQALAEQENQEEPKGNDIEQKEPEEKPSLEELTKKLAKSEKQTEDTKAWAYRVQQEKVDLEKALEKMKEEGILDEDKIPKTSKDIPITEFWGTVEPQIKGYSETFNQKEPMEYFNAFKEHVKELTAYDHEALEKLNNEAASLPSSAWVKFALEKGKEQYDSYYQYLGGKSLKDAFHLLRKENESLKKKLEKGIIEDGLNEKPLLSGNNSFSPDSSSSSLSTQDVLRNKRLEKARYR